MANRLLPFRQYNEHFVINLFRLKLAGETIEDFKADSGSSGNHDAGLLVKVSDVNWAKSEPAGYDVAAAEKAIDDKLMEFEASNENTSMSEDTMRGESLMQPLVKRRAAISATGYAVISIQHHTIPAQQRLLAIRASKLDAYRGLSEQVFGQYLDATTTVADMVIKSDVFRTKVEGII